jgi:hypothetical protein
MTENANDSVITWLPGIKLNSIRDSVIIMALKWFNGNRTKTAASLGLSIRGLQIHIRRLNKNGHNI